MPVGAAAAKTKESGRDRLRSLGFEEGPAGSGVRQCQETSGAREKKAYASSLLVLVAFWGLSKLENFVATHKVKVMSMVYGLMGCVN